jgi:ribosomal protein L21E
MFKIVKRKEKMVLLSFLLLIQACYTSSMVGQIRQQEPVTKADYASELHEALTTSSSPEDLLKKIKIIHQKAYVRRDSIVYPPGDTFHISIPLYHEPIKLTDHTDFNGCTFIIKNNQKDVFLFEIGTDSQLKDIIIQNEQLKAGKVISAGGGGDKLLIVKDNNLWTTRYDYNSQGEISKIKQLCYRKDIFFVKDYIIMNNPISSYDRDTSSPSCQYVDISLHQKIFRNLNLIRDKSSSAVTNLIQIKFQYNIELSNIHVITELQTDERKRFYHDQCFYIENSAKVQMTDITVHNTYSGITNWGYAIEMNNVWDCSFSKLNISAIRGGLNTTCANTLYFQNCQVNRVDVHYYGRDIVCNQCTFTNTTNDFHVYNRVSSFYGKIVFTHCLFNRFLPLRIDSEYNSFTKFDIEMEDCTLNVICQIPSYYNCICHIPILGSFKNNRPELYEKHLPNLTIRRLSITAPQDVKDFYFFNISKNQIDSNSNYIHKLDIKDIAYSTGPNSVLAFHDCNYPIRVNHRSVRKIREKK